MRTFLSHDATARCSLCGEKEISEMLSSGGWLRATSFFISPCVLFAAAAWLPKRPDIVEELEDGDGVG